MFYNKGLNSPPNVITGKLKAHSKKDESKQLTLFFPDNNASYTGLVSQERRAMNIVSVTLQ